MEPPPIDYVPPNVGKALTEQTHPFAIKGSGAMYGGPRCNHDIGVLLRCPKLIGSDDTEQERVDRAMGDLASATNASDFYCSSYVTKDRMGPVCV